MTGMAKVNLPAVARIQVIEATAASAEEKSLTVLSSVEHHQ
jgi:hypothetical protein